MDRKTIITKGEAVLYDGLASWIYQPNPKSNKCYLVIENGPVIPVEWDKIWTTNGNTRPVPNLKYSEELGVDILNLPDSCGRVIEYVQCPICGAHYTNRFEYREDIQLLCDSCRGNGARAMYLEALLEGYLELIRKEKDIALAEVIKDKVTGYFEFEFRRTIRALKENKTDE